MSTRKKTPPRPGGSVRTLYTPPKDEHGMVVVLLQEGTEVLDTNRDLIRRVITSPYPVRIPEENLVTPPPEWETDRD